MSESALDNRDNSGYLEEEAQFGLSQILHFIHEARVNRRNVRS